MAADSAAAAAAADSAAAAASDSAAGPSTDDGRQGGQKAAKRQRTTAASIMIEQDGGGAGGGGAAAAAGSSGRKHGRPRKGPGGKGSAGANDLFCLCRQPYNPSDFMIMCDICVDWFHPRCVGVRKTHERKLLDGEEIFVCPECMRAQEGMFEEGFEPEEEEEEESGGKKKRTRL